MIPFGRTEFELRASFALNLMLYSSKKLVRFDRIMKICQKSQEKIKNSISFCRTFRTYRNQSKRIESRVRIKFESNTGYGIENIRVYLNLVVSGP